MNNPQPYTFVTITRDTLEHDYVPRRHFDTLNKQADELRAELDNAKLRIHQSVELISRDVGDLAVAKIRIARMERELLGVKRIVELAYENRLAIPGMLQAINDYEDALKPG